MHRLFVYGTLQHPPLLRHLLGRAPALEAASVSDWRAARLLGRVYPGLVPAAGGRARGHLLDVDDAEVDVLDRFEGSQYERTTVVSDGGPVSAWRLRDEHLGLVLDEDWDLDRFLVEDAAAFLDASRPGDEHPWSDQR